MKPLFDPSLHVRHKIKSGISHANEIPPAPEGQQLRRVWTVMEGADLVGRGLVHNETAFIEDHRHDWQLDPQGRLVFYSRVVETNTDVDVVLDYEPMPERELRLKENGLNVSGKPLKPVSTPKPGR